MDCRTAVAALSTVLDLHPDERPRSVRHAHRIAAAPRREVRAKNRTGAVRDWPQPVRESVDVRLNGGGPCHRQMLTGGEDDVGNPPTDQRARQGRTARLSPPCHPQPTAVDNAAHMAFMMVGLARPTRRTRRARPMRCTLSRLTTDSIRTPSAGPSRTSVDKPRIVEVTGALMTDWSNRPIGSRLRTTTGRTLSSRASHTSPRRGALFVAIDLGIESLPVGLVGETARIRQ